MIFAVVSAHRDKFVTGNFNGFDVFLLRTSVHYAEIYASVENFPFNLSRFFDAERQFDAFKRVRRVLCNAFEPRFANRDGRADVHGGIFQSGERDALEIVETCNRFFCLEKKIFAVFGQDDFIVYTVEKYYVVILLQIGYGLTDGRLSHSQHFRGLGYSAVFDNGYKHFQVTYGHKNLHKRLLIACI